MKRLKVNIVLMILWGVLLSAATHAEDNYTPLPPYLDGSMMPYDFSSASSVYLPDSLTPVYASYIARHGSRYLSGPVKLQPVVDALQKGRRAGTLSETGEAFFTLVNKIKKANEGNWGDLSPKGYAEENILARRLFSLLNPLDCKDSKVNAVSSYMPRCVMTMYLFTHGLIRENDFLMTRTDEGHQFEALLCCFMADRAFADFRKDGKWKEIYRKYEESYVSPDPARRLFTQTDLSESELRRLTFDMYEVLKANRAAGLPAPTTQWMSVREYEGCWQASNLQHYLRNTVSPVSDLAGKATAPLLEKIISDIDIAAQSDSPEIILNGYFGHAETLLPLLSLMKLAGCYDDSEDYSRLGNIWKIQNITPLAANLTILLSRTPSGRKYVSMQLNGKSIRPIQGEPEFVLWTELRKYWLDLLKG